MENSPYRPSQTEDNVSHEAMVSQMNKTGPHGPGQTEENSLLVPSQTKEYSPSQMQGNDSSGKLKENIPNGSDELKETSSPYGTSQTKEIRPYEPTQIKFESLYRSGQTKENRSIESSPQVMRPSNFDQVAYATAAVANLAHTTAAVASFTKPKQRCSLFHFT